MFSLSFPTLSRPLVPGYRQKAGRPCGQYEVIHNLVCTGHVSWNKDGSSQFESFVLPPVQLERTNAPQISAGLCVSLERHLFNKLGWETWLQSLAATYSQLNVFIMADSASANIKLTWRLCSWLQKKGKQYGINVSVHYNPCMLHQVARMVVSGLL